MLATGSARGKQVGDVQKECKFFTTVPKLADGPTGMDCLLYNECHSTKVYGCAHGCEATTYAVNDATIVADQWLISHTPSEPPER